MSQEHELDERLRQRVASLYEREAPAAVDVAARARALGEAWRVQRRARRRRVQVVALSCGVMAAAAGVLIVLRGGWLQPSAAGKTPQPMAAAGCRLPEAPAWSVAAGGQRVLALGALGRLVGDGKVVASSACELRLEVADGTLAGQLHALRPSRIVIATVGGSVIVTGTRFSVRAREDELRVVLAAGKVRVEEPGGAVQELDAGHVLSRRGGGAASTLPLSAAEASRLDQLLGLAEDDERAVLTSTVAEEIAANDDRHAIAARDGVGAQPSGVVTERTDVAAASPRRTTERPTRIGNPAAPGGENGGRASRRGAAHDGAQTADFAPAASRRPAGGATRVLDDGNDAARTDAESTRGSAPARERPPAGEAAAPAANSRAAEDGSGSSFTCDARRDGAADSGELLAEGELARRKGRLALARRCYAAAADGGNADAEVALLRWVRLELDHDALEHASALLTRHAREYARPILAAEAAWLGVQVLAARGESDSARAAAEELIRAHATTPQARAARAWLRQQ